MADTYPNPYTAVSPIGAALKNLAGVITKGNDTQNILRAEAALKLKRQNENTGALGDVFRRYGTPSFDPAAATDLAIRAGVTPEHLGGYDRYNAATRYGADDPRTTNAAVGAGEAYGSTAAGFREGQAGQDRRTRMGIDEQRYQFNNKPQAVGGPNGPVFATQETAIGQPVAPPANSTPRMYVNPDGTRHMTVDNQTDHLTGQPLQPGGSIVSVQGDPSSVGLRPSVQGSLQESNIANERMKRIGAYAQSLISPQNVGATGVVKSFAQDAAQLAQNLATGLGYTGLSDALGDLQKRAQATGVGKSLPGLFTFDPSLPKVETAYDMLVMSAADAFAGGMNKASDRDIKIIKSIVGSPKDLFASPVSLNARMAAVNDIIGINQGVNNDQLRGGNGPQTAAPQAAPGAVQPPAAASGAPPIAAPPADVPTATGPNGQKLFLRNGQWLNQ